MVLGAGEVHTTTVRRPQSLRPSGGIGVYSPSPLLSLTFSLILTFVVYLFLFAGRRLSVRLFGDRLNGTYHINLSFGISNNPDCIV